MFDVGGGELLVIILGILLLFGPKKIPEVAQMMGKGLRQFRKAQEDLSQQIRDLSTEAAEATNLNVEVRSMKSQDVSESESQDVSETESQDVSESGSQDVSESESDDAIPRIAKPDASTDLPGSIARV
jgi:TatA/E family protein of Tat protein translocase